MRLNKKTLSEIFFFICVMIVIICSFAAWFSPYNSKGFWISVVVGGIFLIITLVIWFSKYR